MKERRKHPRVDVNLEAEIFFSRAKDEVVGPLPAKVINLSEGGAMVQCPGMELKIGQRILLEIAFGDSDTSFHSEVVEGAGHTQVAEDAGEVKWIGGKHTFGVEFVGLSDDRKDFLKEILDYFAAQQPT